MNIQSFLEHHGIVRNPFAEEDAQTDQVFKEYCISSAYHPVWDKVYGDPKDPSTAIVFGPKGSGKTAMRLQIDQHLQKYNKDNPAEQVFIIRYDDFNPFLDHFCERMSRRTTRKPEKVLDAWKLWDHMDSLLCLGVTNFVDDVVDAGKPDSKSSIDPAKLKKLDRTAARDMLLLASCYDQSTDSAFVTRWNSLRKKLRYGNWRAKWSCILAWVWSILVILFFALLFLRPAADSDSGDAAEANVVRAQEHFASVYPSATSVLATDSQVAPFSSTDAFPLKTGHTLVAEKTDEPAGDVAAAGESAGFFDWFNSVFQTRPAWKWLWLAPLVILLGCLPYLIRWVKCHLIALGIKKHMRVGKREVGSIRRVLMGIPAKELASQPLPRFDRTDDRYELLNKFQAILEQMGYTGTVVLMDRVDEPHLTGGKPELMRRFVWPLLDNKLLKHPGLGFKMMLPQELHRDMERESREFHERARLDKQNVIPAFQWTGESLYDLTRARMMACAADGASPEPKHLFADDLEYKRLISAFRTLRVPRHLFRFLYRVLVDHCNRYTDSEPEFQIKAETFETVHAVYDREANPTAG
ncbi:hypothetical protein [Stieleria marina]|uniref:Uncharacterized protein n=1 Tax=Stieleria marina TaxID=1930275 RepID=A0A517NPX4_9BACT|nr:hypothetical protein K239x_11190 [Planctomycetes bacterium K23_9]